MEPTDEVVEIGTVDLLPDGTIRVFGSELVKPEKPMPPAARAVHHISDAMVADALPWSEVWPGFFSGIASEDVVAYAAHKASFDAQWITEERRGGKSIICTWKCAMRQWPDAPGFSNQCLRYWLGIEIGAEAEPCHRALPDAFVTAHIVVELLKHNKLETLIEWSNDPAVYPTITFGKHKGKKWSEPPLDYLEWVSTAKDMEADVVWNAVREIKHRQANAVRLKGEARTAYVEAAKAAGKLAVSVVDLNAWWATEATNRISHGITKGTTEYADIAKACADRKADIEKVSA